MAQEQQQQQQRQETEEDDDDNFSISPSIASSVLTAEGIHDPVGFFCVCLVILIGDMSRGCMFPSMWPLVESLGGSRVTLGYAVAAFSFGRVLVNPVFGSWSHTLGYTVTLVTSCAVLFLGTLLYAQVENVGRPEFLVVAQTVLGVGSGTLGVTRAFVADVTARRHRTTYMAWITAVQYGGFTVTPAFGALFTKLLDDAEYKWGLFRMNKYTAPAYFMAVIVASTMATLCMFFQDRQRHAVAVPERKKKSARRQEIDSLASAEVGWLCRVTVYDCCILGCMLLNVSTKGSIASFETLGIAIAQDYFDMLASRAGIIIATCGAFGVGALLSMGRLEQRFTDVQIITGGMLVMATGIASLTAISSDETNPSWTYCVAMFLIYSVGYPIGHTAVIGLFSKSTCGQKSEAKGCYFVASSHTNSVTLSFYCHSCRTKATGDVAGMVCVGRIHCTHVLSHHVRVRGQLCDDSDTLLDLDGCLVPVVRIYSVGPTDLDSAIVVVVVVVVGRKWLLALCVTGEGGDTFSGFVVLHRSKRSYHICPQSEMGHREDDLLNAPTTRLHVRK
jgi:ceroid-lipofuscinosis MFS transporter 7